MGNIIVIILWVLLSVSVGHAQVSQGTVNSRTLDGNGNKITSTVVGPDRAINVYCLGGTCSGGGGGSTYLDADGIVNQTAGAVHGQTYMYNGVTWDRVRGTIAGGLEVNCVTGCAGGSSTPIDGFVNPTTAGIQQTFNMVYNGVTWDRLRGTVLGGALVNISNASLAVTGTFFQATQPISAVALPLPLGAATETTLTNVLTTSAFQARVNTLGQKTMANSTPVVLPSDQAAIPVTILSTVGSASNDGACPSGGASFTVIASNASRTWLAIWASPANTDDVYVKLGATATTSDARIAPGQTINFTSGRIYTGIVDAIPNSGTQAVCVMELN